MNAVARVIRGACLGLGCGLLVLASACQQDKVWGPPPTTLVASVTLTAPSAVVSLNATLKLEPSYFDASGTALVGITGATWTSSNASIITVDESGLIAGIKLGGPVTVTVANNGKSASLSFSVVPGRIGFSPAVTSLPVNETVQLTASPLDFLGLPINADVGPVAWTSLTPDVATVGATSGLVTAIAVGTARITASAGGRTSELDIFTGWPGPYDGAWTGLSESSGGPFPVEITVVFGRVRKFQVTYSAAAGATCMINNVPVWDVDAPITDGQYSFTFESNTGVQPYATRTTLVTGAVTSPTMMTVTHNGMYTGSCSGLVSGVLVGRTGAIGGATFTATRQ